MVQKTIFSKIINGDIPCEEVYRDEHCLAFRDIQPQAPVHILVIPCKEIASLLEAKNEDTQLLGHLLPFSTTD